MALPERSAGVRAVPLNKAGVAATFGAFPRDRLNPNDGSVALGYNRYRRNRTAIELKSRLARHLRRIFLPVPGFVCATTGIEQYATTQCREKRQGAKSQSELSK